MGDATVTKTEVERVAKLAAEAAVQGTLRTLGVDVGDPIQAQKDFQWLREHRVLGEAILRRGVLTVVGIGVSAIAFALWAGFKHFIQQQG